MSRDFLKTSTPEVWTKEESRNEQFMKLEIQLFQYDIENNYLGMLKVLRIILRLQMEVFEEEIVVDGKKVKVQGINTPTFQNLRDKLNELEDTCVRIMKNSHDPVARGNNKISAQTFIRELQQVTDQVFHNNTVFGLNYRKKNDPTKAAYG